MDLLESSWLISHGGTRLLSVAELMTTEVKMPWAAQGETVARANAAFASQVSYGNAVNGLEFSRLLAFDAPEDARDYLLAHNAALPDGVADTAVKSTDGATYILRGARLAGVSPRIEDGSRFVCDYQLGGGKLERADTATATAAVHGYTNAGSAGSAAVLVLDYVNGSNPGGTFTLDGTLQTLPAASGGAPSSGDLPVISGWSLVSSEYVFTYTANTNGSHTFSDGTFSTADFTNGAAPESPSGATSSATAKAAVAGQRIGLWYARLDVTGGASSEPVALYLRKDATDTQLTEARTTSGEFAITNDYAATGKDDGESLVLKYTGSPSAFSEPANTATATFCAIQF